MRKWELYIEQHSEVKAWLQNRPVETKRSFALRLQNFCEAIDMSPEEWRQLDKIEARDLAWQFVKPSIAEHPSVAKITLTALKNWYRNLNGEVLPFDSTRGGKHYFHITRKKAALEHIPSKSEMYQIVDMTSSLRDKSMLLLLFQAGVRVNTLEHLTYGDVADQLDKDIIVLKITGRLDHKLRGRDIPFYYTFLNGEGAETLRQYCKVKHKDRANEKPLFYTWGNKPISQKWILKIVKICVKRAGFNPTTMWTHTIRKAFRKIVRQTDIDDDDKEQLMGHVIHGSREAYFDKKDVSLIMKAYQKCNFSRELPESEMAKLRQQLEDSRLQNRFLEQKQRKTDDELDKIITRLQKQDSELDSLKKLIRERTSQN